MAGGYQDYEVIGMDLSAQEGELAYVEIGETEKNGQEDTHFYEVAVMDEDGVWSWNDDDRYYARYGHNYDAILKGLQGWNPVEEGLI